MKVDRLPIFLGVSLHAQRRGIALDLFEVSDFLILPFFPQSIQGAALVFAFPAVPPDSSREFNIVLRSEREPTHHVKLQCNMNPLKSTEDLTIRSDALPEPAILNRELAAPR
jgi:hypothetical protein